MTFGAAQVCFVCMHRCMGLRCLVSVCVILNNMLIKPQALGRINLGESAQIVIASANGGDSERNPRLNQVCLIFATIKHSSWLLALLKSNLKTRTGKKRLILCFSGVEQVFPGNNF